MKCFNIIILLLSTLTSSHGLDKSITTGFQGTNQAQGNIFTIKAKTQPISITGFDINMSGPPAPNPAPVEIYFLPGVDPGKKSSTHVYQKIFEGSIFGAGKNNVTSLPALANPVVIPAGSSYSFYITVANYTLGTYLYFHKNLGGVGSVMASDEYMEVLQGYSLAYPFFAYSGDWRWNGNVYYFVETEPSPPSTITPTMMATLKPTTSQPTSSKPTTLLPTSLGQTPPPTTKQPTPQPMLQPTLPPTKQPTSQPTLLGQTLKPTPQPMLQPTLPPTKQPTSQPTLLGQTLEPTIQPSSEPPSLLTFTPTGQPWEETFSPSPSITLSPTVSKVTRMPTKRPTKSSSAKMQLCIYPALLTVAVFSIFP